MISCQEIDIKYVLGVLGKRQPSQTWELVSNVSTSDTGDSFQGRSSESAIKEVVEMDIIMETTMDEIKG